MKWFEQEIREECARWNLKAPDDFHFGGGELQLQLHHFLRFESLESDWNELVATKQWHCQPFPHANKTASREADYRKYYTPQTERFVAEHFRRTIEHFGYTF